MHLLDLLTRLRLESGTIDCPPISPNIIPVSIYIYICSPLVSVLAVETTVAISSVMAEAQPLLAEKMASPSRTSTSRRKTPHILTDTALTTTTCRDRHGRRIPQAIAHRGYKTTYPENTMGAFRGAVEVGAHAIETDLHITKDGVIVLSHDATLKRCFGREEKVIDCDWEYIKTLRTLKEPQEQMPRLKDLLKYLASPGVENVWLLLDIKLDNDADTVMRLIAETVASVKPSRPWESRVVLGVWAVSL